MPNNGSPSNPPGKSESTPITEGTINGGGGKGVRCVKDGKVTVRTLDLYEATVVHGLELTQMQNSQDAALDLLTSLFTTHFWNPDTMPMEEYKKNYREYLSSMLTKGMRFTKANQKLRLIDDAHEPILEEGCEVVQIAVYYDETNLLVDNALWSQLDWANKAALMAHELVYYTARQNGETNSIATRKLVGQMFSTKGPRPKADGVPADKTMFARCTVFSKNLSVGYFYAFDSKRNERTGLELVFTYLKNDLFLFRTSAFLNDASLTSLFEPDQKWSQESDLFVESYPERQFLKFDFIGAGQGTLLIMDKANGSVSDPLSISCGRSEQVVEP